MLEIPYSSVTRPQISPQPEWYRWKCLALQDLQGDSKVRLSVSATSKATPHAICSKTTGTKGTSSLSISADTWEALDGSSVVGDTSTLQSLQPQTRRRRCMVTLAAKSHGEMVCLARSPTFNGCLQTEVNRLQAAAIKHTIS